MVDWRPAVVVDGVDVGVAPHQQLAHGSMTRLCCRRKRRHSRSVALVHRHRRHLLSAVGAICRWLRGLTVGLIGGRLSHEPSHHLQMPLLRAHPHRARAIAGERARLGAMLEQERDDLGMAALCRPASRA